MNEHSLIFAVMRPRDDNKVEALMKHALKMIVKTGFDGLSMQKLAKAAGVSPATIYIYFKDRDDLILQLFLREHTKHFDYILQDFDPNMDLATGLKVQWKNRVHYILHHPDEAHFLEHFSFTPLHVKAIKMKDPRIAQCMRQFVSNAIRNKELIEMSHELYWSIAFSPLYNLLRWHQMGRNTMGEKFELTDTVMDQALALVLKALKP